MKIEWINRQIPSKVCALFSIFQVGTRACRGRLGAFPRSRSQRFAGCISLYSRIGIFLYEGLFRSSGVNRANPRRCTLYRYRAYNRTVKQVLMPTGFTGLRIYMYFWLCNFNFCSNTYKFFFVDQKRILIKM